MNPSSIACRMEYRWNGRSSDPAGVSTRVPNSSSVLAFGVGKHSARRFPPCYYLIVKDSAGDGVSATG